MNTYAREEIEQLLMQFNAHPDTAEALSQAIVGFLTDTIQEECWVNDTPSTHEYFKGFIACKAGVLEILRQSDDDPTLFIEEDPR